MKISALRDLADSRLRGGLGVADAKALIDAAGTGKAATKKLQKILVEYKDSFTAKGMAQLQQVVGADKPASGKLNKATRDAVMDSFLGLEMKLGRQASSLPMGNKFVELHLLAERHVDGFQFAAMIPAGRAGGTGSPNSADHFFVRKTGGFAGITAFYGPFDIARGGKTKQVVVGEAKNGKTVTVGKGKDLVIELPATTGSSGYRWHVTGTDRSFGYPVKDDYLQAGVPGRVGGAGTQRLVWKTDSAHVRPGSTHHLTLSYQRGDSGTPAKSFELSVKIG